MAEGGLGWRRESGSHFFHVPGKQLGRICQRKAEEEVERGLSHLNGQGGGGVCV